jgi:hypothetical protein
MLQTLWFILEGDSGRKRERKAVLQSAGAPLSEECGVGRGSLIDIPSGFKEI